MARARGAIFPRRDSCGRRAGDAGGRPAGASSGRRRSLDAAGAGVPAQRAVKRVRSKKVVSMSMSGLAGRRSRGRIAVRVMIVLVVALGVVAAVLTVPRSSRAADATGRVIVLGFDGADARLVEKWMDEGRLPNLDRLRKEGSYTPLLPTNPAQTPVSWSSFATGINPGRTQIFDFLKRIPNSYVPTFALNEEAKRPFLYGAKNPPIL